MNAVQEGDCPDKQSDEALARRAGKGDEDAFACLVHRHMPMVLGLAARYRGPWLEPKDLAQEGGTKLGNILSRVIGKTSYSWDENKTKISFTTNAVSNFMESQKETIKDNMLSYLSYYTLAKWLNLIKPDEATRFEQRLVEIEEELRLLGAQRDKPKRTTSTTPAT